MNNSKKWLIVAFSLIIVGIIIFIGVITVLKWDFTKLSTVKYETNDYNISEEYKNILINSDTADIIFVPTDNLTTHIECFEEMNANHIVKVKGDTLLIVLNDTRKWYEHIHLFSFKNQKVTVHMPKGEYGTLSIKSDTSNIEMPKDFKFESVDIAVSTGNVKNYASTTDGLKISTSTGNIDINTITAGEVKLSVSTGRVNASTVVSESDFSVDVSTGKTNIANIICKNLFSNGSTGNISLNNTIASDAFVIKRSTGNVLIDGCDAKEINITTDTGDVKGSLLSNKIFITRTDTGKIDVPKTIEGGKCEITTDTGDIKFNIE